MLLLAVREVRMLSLVLSQHQVLLVQREGMQTHLAHCAAVAAAAVVVVVVCRLLELEVREGRGAKLGTRSHLGEE